MTNLAPSDREVVADEGWRLSPATLLTEIAPGHIPPKHLLLVAWFLKAVQRGVVKRLAISLPPGFSKSTLVSWAFPVWLYDWDPSLQLILASYESSRAVHWSAKIRDTLQDKQLNLHAEVGAGSEARNEWFTTAGGRMLAAGLNGPITGVRAHGLIVDDPIKNAAEAASLTMRDKAWSNYESAALTRLFPGGWICVVSTRWSEDDLVGRLIRRQANDRVQWVYVRLPAVATEFETIETVIGKDTAEWLRSKGERLPQWSREPGEPLWPSRFDPEVGRDVPWYDEAWVQEKRSESDHHTWETVYQQNPTVPGGDMFPEIQWGRANAVPSGCRFARGWDLAGTAGAGDWTVGALIAVHPTRGVTVVDVVRGQWDGAGVIATMRATAERDHERLGPGVVTQVVEQEPGSSGKPLYNKAMILMVDGNRKELGDIQVGDRVITHTGTARNVLAVHEQGELETVQIETDSGRTTVAALDHPFMTPAGWVEAADLRPGMVLANVFRPQLEQKPDSDQRLPEEFRLAGYFVGDGACGFSHKGSRAPVSTIVCFDPVELVDIQHCVKTLGFTMKESTSRPGNYDILGGCRPWLREIGLAGQKSYQKRVPEWVFTAPAHLAAQFIGAYFVCDGSLRVPGSKMGQCAEFYSVSRELLADVQHLLLRFGIQSSLRGKNGRYLEKRHKSWRLSMLAREDSFALLANIPMYHSQKGVECAAEFRKRFDRTYSEDVIRSVTPAGLRPCRCLTVEGDHTFTADDFVVHNSWTAQITRELAPYPVAAIPPAGNKTERARGFAAQQQNGNVALLRRTDGSLWGPAPWWDAFVTEFASFDSGEHDDQVDAVVHAFNHLMLTKTPGRAGVATPASSRKRIVAPAPQGVR